MSNFIEACLAGHTVPDEIDDFVENWHDGDSQLPLFQFLGMTHREYSLWVKNPDILPLIITAHRKGCKFETLLQPESTLGPVARSDKPSIAVNLHYYKRSESRACEVRDNEKDGRP